MNNDLTINSGTFTQNYSDKTGSLRTNSAAGVNLPVTMEVKHQKYVDSTTKVAGRQSALIFKKFLALSDGRIAPAVEVTLKVRVLEDAAITSANVTDTVDLVVGVIQEDDSGLDQAEEIFVGLQQ